MAAAKSHFHYLKSIIHIQLSDANIVILTPNFNLFRVYKCGTNLWRSAYHVYCLNMVSIYNAPLHPLVEPFYSSSCGSVHWWHRLIMISLGFGASKIHFTPLKFQNNPPAITRICHCVKPFCARQIFYWVELIFAMVDFGFLALIIVLRLAVKFHLSIRLLYWPCSFGYTKCKLSCCKREV